MNNFFQKTRLQNIAIASVIAIFFLLDRYLKYKALKSAPIKLIGDIFLFRFTSNPYIAFSLPLTGTVLNAAIILIIILLTAYIARLLAKKELGLPLLLFISIWAGSISNMFDRLAYGFVVDYLELRFFTVFNLADVMITVSVALLILMNASGKSIKQS